LAFIGVHWRLNNLQLFGCGSITMLKTMKRFFAPNISNRGRLVRALGALLLLVGAVFAIAVTWWLAGALLALGVLVGFEALRGWCFLRACGIKTKL
jgi:hypothetical protein